MGNMPCIWRSDFAAPKSTLKSRRLIIDALSFNAVFEYLFIGVNRTVFCTKLTKWENEFTLYTANKV